MRFNSMNAVNRIHFEDGPEDGRVISHAILLRLHTETGRVATEIPLYLDPNEKSAPTGAFLLGRYRLGKVKEGTATYRWRPA